MKAYSYDLRLRVLRAVDQGRLDDLEARNKTESTWWGLGSGEQIATKGRGKGCCKSMKRNDQSGSIRRTSIARQADAPGKTLTERNLP